MSCTVKEHQIGLPRMLADPVEVTSHLIFGLP